MSSNPLRLASVEFRDGQQSLLATRMRTADMLPILETMDRVGYDCMEMWGGATFDACIRFLGEDPWERVRQFKKRVVKTLNSRNMTMNLGGGHEKPRGFYVPSARLRCGTLRNVQSTLS